jgi:enoyl-[acyl-carrier protein] reductase I
MGLMTGKNILVTGVLTPGSIAFDVARLVQEEGGTVVLTSFGRSMSLTGRTSKRLPVEAPVVELDVTNAEHLETLAARVREHVPTLDGVLHSIAFAPQDALGGNFLNTPWESVQTAVQISAFSLKSLAMATLPLMPNGGSIVGLTFDATVAWPVYDWMGVAKAAFESTNRYLARDLGAKNVRCNLVAAGPLATVAAKSIPGFETIVEVWNNRAPIGWDFDDTEPSARACVALMSDWFPKTTGEIVHVDGGVHAISG